MNDCIYIHSEIFPHNTSSQTGKLIALKYTFDVQYIALKNWGFIFHLKGGGVERDESSALVKFEVKYWYINLITKILMVSLIDILTIEIFLNCVRPVNSCNFTQYICILKISVTVAVYA